MANDWDMASALTRFWTTVLPELPEFPDLSKISERLDFSPFADDSSPDYSTHDYYEEDYSPHDYPYINEIAVEKQECCDGVVDIFFLGSVLGVIGFIALFLRQAAIDNINNVPRTLRLG